MSKYRAYPEYKDSGVEWLGKIPSLWTVSRIKNVALLNPSKSEVRFLPSDTEVSFFPMETIGDEGELDVSKVKNISEVLNGYTYVAEGDVMIAKITPCFENGKGAIARKLKNQIGFATTEVIPIRPNRATDAKYLYYLLHCNPFKSIAEGSMYGAGGQKRVSDNFVSEYHFSLPCEGERDVIAEFLDHETAKIDTLIEKQQQLIKLLKEKRQAVISHAVTKGLNPNVPMKDSGVEWLGEVPAHWVVCRVKQVASFLTSGPRGWSDYISEQGNQTFLQSGDLNNNLGLELDSAKKLFAPENAEGVRTLLQDGDVVICITGANTGRVAVARIKNEVVYINQHLCLIRPIPEQIDFDFLGALLSSSALRVYFSISQYGLKEGLSLSNVAEAPVCYPPLVEQLEIIKAIKSANAKYDRLETAANVQIGLLQERRTALISAAVTGKIDVRDWQPPVTTDSTALEATP